MEITSRFLISGRDLAGRPGEWYILYFTHGGSAAVNLSAYPGEFTLRWVNIQTGGWGPRAAIAGGAGAAITAPGQGPWVAAIRRR